MKKYLFMIFIIIVMIFNGCECRNPFKPKTPEFPIDTIIIPTTHEPTKPVYVITNLWNYCSKTPNITEYMKCFTHPKDYEIKDTDDELTKKTKKHYQFTFIIHEDWKPEISSWDYDTEEKYNRKMFEEAKIDLTLTDYEDKTIEENGKLEDGTLTGKKEAKILNVKYEIKVGKTGELYEEGSGYISFWLVQEGTNDKPVWKIYRWIDSKQML